MEHYVNITLDGAMVQAAKGGSVLETALAYGVCIPHLCHIPNFSGFGACRLCVVEIVEKGRAKVTTSCTLEPREGMTVATNSPKIRRLRKNIAELLVAEAPNSRAVQDVAVRCGVKKVRYPFRNNACVLCGRCVRTCDQTWRAKSIGFVGRGKDRHVDFPFGIRPAWCKTCLRCGSVCPMTIAPCYGPMNPGEERLCAQCESQLMLSEQTPGSCVRCELGKGFGCTRSGWE